MVLPQQFAFIALFQVESLTKMTRRAVGTVSRVHQKNMSTLIPSASLAPWTNDLTEIGPGANGYPWTVQLSGL